MSSVFFQYIETSTPRLDKDPYFWQINDATRDYIVKNGFDQNMNCDFTNSKRQYDTQSRYFSKRLLERKLHNGETKTREWIIYSESTGKIYCGPCLAFCGGTQFGSREGFDDWKNSIRIEQHENSDSHKNSLLSLIMRENIVGTINEKLTESLHIEIKYWKQVLRRVISVIKKLSSRGLPFRGHTEKFGSVHSENYIMSLELLVEYDPFLAEYISRYGNPSSGRTSYLSSLICNEFIELMAEEILQVIFKEARESKYFSIIVDSTPDLSHIDQLTLILRYVKPDGSPIERFIKFLPNVGHKGTEIANAILLNLNKVNIDIKNCRGQSYDNASNMSGIYNGVQAKIRDICPYSEYIPCSAHSLNLVGICAAEICKESCTFFNIFQELHNLFSLSTYRWQILQDQCEAHKKREDYVNESRSTTQRKTIKILSVTRWSARHDSCESLLELWEPIQESLEVIKNDPSQKPLVKCQAKGIQIKLERLETAILSIFWEFVLQRINAVSKRLQNDSIDIFLVVNLYDSLIQFVTEIRNDKSFDNFEKKALLISKTKNCSGERSFSTLKRIKNYLRTSITQERLNSLALLNIENEILEGINFNNLIQRFAETKCKRKTFM
ncbi:Zinc finger MYM-type protein 1 [Cyphomyrmex costatus]|uniref:Zinc finger MYM-type protein 1 n=1 Tax=Cyphomyrmex costatus TaxID=456900 RepID=A0A151IJ93_9HYME|nr:Zinc finger MYM-type protein 1 [Cyphomyrmex costatus]